jgi:hypothetical protein
VVENVETGETYLTLGKAARTLPGNPSPCSLWRWGRVGIKDRTGRRHFLELIRQGGKVFVTATALADFFARVSAADQSYFAARAERAEADAKVLSPAPRSEARRAKAIARAKRELAARGV